jgi:hypothetical protein
VAVTLRPFFVWLWEMTVGEGEEMIVPGNNRKMQVRTKGEGCFSGRGGKETFLENLAANCNLEMSAKAAGVAVNTVYAHRIKDREFAGKWWLALERGRRNWCRCGCNGRWRRPSGWW